MSELNPAWINTVQNASSLENLRDALMGAWAARPEGMDVDEFDDAIGAGAIPSFGGKLPPLQGSVWSWDAKRVLVGDSIPELKIISREV